MSKLVRLRKANSTRRLQFLVVEQRPTLLSKVEKSALKIVDVCCLHRRDWIRPTKLFSNPKRKLLDVYWKSGNPVEPKASSQWVSRIAALLGVKVSSGMRSPSCLFENL